MTIKSSKINLSRHTTAVGVALGVFCSLIISIVLLAAFAGLSISGRSEGGLEKIALFIIRFVSVLIGVVAGTGWVKDKWLIISALIVSGYTLLLVICCVVMFNGVFNGLWTGILSAIIGGGLGCVIRVKLQNKPLKRRKIKK